MPWVSSGDLGIVARTLTKKSSISVAKYDAVASVVAGAKL